MTWPADQAKTNVDQVTDDPKLARSDFAANVDKFNQLQAHVSSFMQGLLDDADAAAARTTLGAIIGTNVQAFDATLTSLAAVVGVSGDILYASGADAWARLAKGTDGDVVTQAAGIPSWAAPAPGITRDTAIATTSGTAHDFTGLAAGLNRITAMFDGVSLSGTNTLWIQLGDSGGFETSGYAGAVGSGSSGTVNTSGFQITFSTSAALLYSGVITLARIDGNTWVSSGNMGNDTGGGNIKVSAGTKTLSGVLDRVRLTRSGSNTFDAGKFNILTE